MVTDVKHVGFRIQDEKVWEEFKEYVRKKYGKLHTALAIEATQALREYLERHAYGGVRESDLEKKIYHLLSVERSMTLRELEAALRVEGERIEAAADKLAAEGKIMSLSLPKGIKIYAIKNDGTLDLSTLPPELQRGMIINACGNKDKGVSYAKLYEILYSQPP